MPETAKLRIIGLNFRTAPVVLREHFPGDRDHVDRLLQEQHGLVDEIVFLGTCNRSEWIVHATDTQADALVADICARAGLARHRFARHFYCHQEDAARRHLYRLAAGLDSMVLGESQILGQLKDVLRYALEANTIDSVLHPLFQRTFCVAKQVRRQTRLGEGAISVGSLAVETARHRLGSFAKARVALLGGGKLAELVAQHLHKQGVRGAHVLNRSAKPANRLAAELEGTARGLEDLPESLRWCDVMICTTASRAPLIDGQIAAAALAERVSRPLTLIDIAVPRDVAPEVAALPGVNLHNIDELQEQLAANKEEREAEVPQAEAIVEACLREDRQANQAAIGPIVRALHQRADAVRDEQLDRLFRRYAWDEATCDDVRQATRLVLRKLLHAPIKALYHQDLDDPERLALIRTLFDLDTDGAEKLDDQSEPALLPQA